MDERPARASPDCAEVRDLLPEYAMGTLPADSRAGVERHLAWCAGCRKEAESLAEGAAVPALALPASEPPPGLGSAVVDAVTSAAGRDRRRPRLPQAAAVVAAVVAAASIGLAAAMAGRLQRLEDAAATARDRADQTAREFESVLEELGGVTPILSAPLEDVSGGQAGGRALLFDSIESEDFAVVIVGGLPEGEGPYRAYLRSSSGDRLAIGRLVPSAEGQVARYRFFFDDVARYGEVLVLDGDGATALMGGFTSGPN